jgi:hypothetical protein
MAARPDNPHRLLAFALFALGFALVFRGWLFTGFDGAFGDEEDGYLALAIIEHWRHVFAGEVHWTDPIIFFPARGTLGYTDAFFLLGAVAAGLRRLGFDAFNAFMLVMAGLAAVGFFGFRRLPSATSAYRRSMRRWAPSCSRFPMSTRSSSFTCRPIARCCSRCCATSCCRPGTARDAARSSRLWRGRFMACCSSRRTRPAGSSPATSC